MQTITQPKPVDLPAFLLMFDASARPQIEAMLARPDVSGIMCFEVLLLDSAQLGRRSAVIFGPGCTSASLEDISGKHLGDVPSRFQYPTHYYLKP